MVLEMTTTTQMYFIVFLYYHIICLIKKVIHKKMKLIYMHVGTKCSHHMSESDITITWMYQIIIIHRKRDTVRSKGRIQNIHALIVRNTRNPESNIHRANVRPIWGRQDPGGHHVGTMLAPMNFAIWETATGIQSQLWGILNRYVCACLVRSLFDMKML